MFAEEWPLMMFTLLMQLAVGSFIFMVIVRSLKNKIGTEESLKVTKTGMLLVGPIVILAFICSVFHLGTPLGAYRSIGNLGSSWLSREILFSGGFFLMWLISFLLEKRGKWSQAAGWIASIIGIGAIFSMASIYTSTIKPAWADVNTYFVFFGTTIVYGAVFAIVLMSLSKEAKTESTVNILKVFTVVGLAAVVLQLIYLPVYTSGLVNAGQAGVQAAHLLTETYGIASVVRWLLTISGFGVLVYVLNKKLEKKAALFYLALILVLIGEFIGRYIFYGTGVSIGIG